MSSLETAYTNCPGRSYGQMQLVSSPAGSLAASMLPTRARTRLQPDSALTARRSEQP
jgi:hypothetical protein